jgi:hypothetical protein
MNVEASTTAQEIFYKVCTNCKQKKETSLFHLKSAGKDGLSPWCKSCKNQETNNRYSKNAVSFVRRLYQMMWCQQKRRKINIQITMNEFIQIWNEQYEKFGMNCPYSGIEMTFKKGEGKLFYNISVDRFDNTKPYEDGNIVFCCMVVNRMKQELPIDEFWRICKSVAENNSIKDLSVY